MMKCFDITRSLQSSQLPDTKTIIRVVNTHPPHHLLTFGTLTETGFVRGILLFEKHISTSTATNRCVKWSVKLLLVVITWRKFFSRQKWHQSSLFIWQCFKIMIYLRSLWLKSFKRSNVCTIMMAFIHRAKGHFSSPDCSRIWWATLSREHASSSAVYTQSFTSGWVKTCAPLKSPLKHPELLHTLIIWHEP